MSVAYLSGRHSRPDVNAAVVGIHA
jgi:hypothetical protein